MSRTRRLALIASIVTATCLVAVGSFVAVSARTASADDTDTVAISAPQAATRADDRTRLWPPVRDQVVSGALGTDPLPGAVTFAYAGDSITARPDSWLHVVESDDRLHAVGGYAHSGYRADQVLREIGPVPDADVLVVELGTNDVNQAVPLTTTLRDVDAVVAKVDARHVLVVAGPPANWTTSRYGADRRTGQLVLSGALREQADENGWSYVDPFTALRAPDGGWKPGTTPDGIHGTAASNVVIARALASAIESAAR